MKPPSQFRAVPVDFPPKTAPLMVNDTDEPDETSFRALRPKMLRLTLGTLLRRLAVTRRVRERYLAICVAPTPHARRGTACTAHRVRDVSIMVQNAHAMLMCTESHNSFTFDEPNS